MQMLGANGHGRRLLPSLEATLHRNIGITEAAPYVKHVALSAPYISASPPITLSGLLVPDINSPKPPCARKRPTRTNLFKASRTLSLDNECGGCPVTNGTIICIHYGSVPPMVYLCTTAKSKAGEILIPYDSIEYQVAASTQFTLATNAAFSFTAEITSFAAAKPLNGLATAAHVMDIDDITVYSTGTYELRSTTPKDSLNSVSLAKGIISIMGPESFTETLIHPYHNFNKTYPGYTFMAQTTDIENNVATFMWEDLTPHRWFVNTTFEITAYIVWEGQIGQQRLDINALLYKGTCPTAGANSVCTKEQPDPDKVPVASRSYPGDITDKVADKDKQKDKETTADNTASTASTEQEPGHTRLGGEGRLNATYDDLNTDTIHFVFTTDLRSNCIGINFDAQRLTVYTKKLQKVAIIVRTLVQDPEHQFGPAALIRLQGLTKDIIIQTNVRAAVAGIQTGESRAVAPPTMPSRLTTGEEDAILTQALFDDPSTPIARIMTTAQFAAATSGHDAMTNAQAASIMEAAPIGDTIRNIAGTLSNIGHGIGGPFGTIGDIIGTVGNIAGGIGDTLGKLFSAPSSKRPRIMAAPPDPAADLAQYELSDFTLSQASVVKDVPTTTPDQVKKDMVAKMGWSVRLNNPIMAKLVPPTDGMHPFPWVTEDQSEAGIANIYITSKPLKFEGRNTSYHRITSKSAGFAFSIDKNLVELNAAKYLGEVIAAMAYCERGGWYITTDAREPVFGDSMSAAIVAACLMPSEKVVITGGFAFTGAGTAAITPVGAVERKLLHCTEEGYIMVAPDTAELRALRAGVSNSPIVTTGDICMGNLTSSPKCILITSIVEMLYALSFANASISTPIGEEEEAAKMKAIRTGEERGQEKLSEMATYKMEGKTPEQQAAIASKTFRVDIPGFGAEDLPIMDIDWWKEQPRFLTQSTREKGMGVPLERILSYINNGMTYKLKGIAMSVRSRILSDERKAKTTRPEIKPGRVPSFKRRDLGAMKALIERARQGQKRAPTSSDQGQPQAKRPV